MMHNFLNGRFAQSGNKPILESRLLARRSPKWLDETLDASMEDVQPHTLEPKTMGTKPKLETFMGKKSLPLDESFLFDDLALSDRQTTWKKLIPQVSLPGMPKISMPRVSVPSMPHVRIEISKPQKQSLKDSSLTNLKAVQKNLRSTWQAGMRESLVDDNMKKSWASSLNTLKNTLADSLAEPGKAAPTIADQIQGLDDIFPGQVSRITASDVGAMEDTFTRTSKTLGKSYQQQPEQVAATQPAEFAIGQIPPQTAEIPPAEAGFNPQMLLFFQTLLGGAKSVIPTPAAETKISDNQTAEIAAELLKAVSDELCKTKAPDIAIAPAEAAIEPEQPVIAAQRKPVSPVSVDPTEMDSDYVFQTMLENNRILGNSIASLADRYFENAAREEAENSLEY